MKFAEQSVEIDVAGFVRRRRKGMAQRRCDAELVVPEIHSNHFTVARRRWVPGHGRFKIHDGITIGGAMSFVFGRIKS